MRKGCIYVLILQKIERSAEYEIIHPVILDILTYPFCHQKRLLLRLLQKHLKKHRLKMKKAQEILR